MSRLQSLVVLTRSMSAAEKKAFTIRSIQAKPDADYKILYDILEKNGNKPVAQLAALFREKRPNASIETTVKYLYDQLLDSMLDLRKDQDSMYSLFNKILKARILYEKSMFDECFVLLDYTIIQAQKYENYYAQLMASRLELEYLLALNFPNLNETSLLQKQFRINEILKSIRRINEQSSLYENLKHRIITRGNPRSQKKKDEFNDLVYSEISIIASQNVENFEINKLHQLFQANYLISVGDYRSALNSFIELNNLFEANKHLWSNPPVYYLFTLEGVLESLRGIRNYEGMAYFINQLRSIETQSAGFRTNLTSLIYLYELFPFLDTGDFTGSLMVLKEYRELLFDKINTLSRARQAEICLYTALVHFGNGDYSGAHKFLNQIILLAKDYHYLPLYRTIRLVNLMILYKLGDFDLIRYEIRSLKRDTAETSKDYLIERYLFKFLIQPLPVTAAKRLRLLEKTLMDFSGIRRNVFERQILRIFDFTAWVESQIRKVPFSEVLQSRMENVAIPEITP